MGKSLKIAVKRSKTEFEIQAEALVLLTDALGPNYIIRGEYTYGRCRFDLAIFRAADREMICTIEIKKKGGMSKHHKQTNKYHWATGRPCVLLTEATMYSAIRMLKARLANMSLADSKAGGVDNLAVNLT